MCRCIFWCLAAGLLLTDAAQARVEEDAGAVQQVLTVSDAKHQTTTAGCQIGFVDLPGAYVKITVPADAKQLLTARFTATGHADGMNPSLDYGAVRIVTGTREFLPIDPNGPYYVTVPNENLPMALERSLVVSPGVHTVRVQYCAADPAGQGTFEVWDWHLTVEASPAP
jgi:hypothetical protein